MATLLATATRRPSLLFLATALACVVLNFWAGHFWTHPNLESVCCCWLCMHDGAILLAHAPEISVYYP